MRSLFGSFAALLMTLVIGCTWVDAGECWPNTSGGFGGGGYDPDRCWGRREPPPATISPSPRRVRSTIAERLTPAWRRRAWSVKFSQFGSANFAFVTIVADDGSDKGGGLAGVEDTARFSSTASPMS